MSLLHQREQTLRHESSALVDQTRDRAAHLRLAETLSAFPTRLRAAAETLDIVERQRIVRLIVKDVLVGDDTIVIRHCILVPSGPPPTGCADRTATPLKSPTIQVTFCVQGVVQHSRGGSLLPSQSVSSWLLRMIDN